MLAFFILCVLVLQTNANTAFHYPLNRYDADTTEFAFNLLRQTLLGSNVVLYIPQIELNVGLYVDRVRDQAYILISKNATFEFEEHSRCVEWDKEIVCMGSNVMDYFLEAESKLVSLVHKTKFQNPNANLILVGHSKGASIASILALSKPKLFSLILFGCPPTGNDAFNRKLKAYSKSLVHVVWKDDPVPIAKQVSDRFVALTPFIRHLNKSFYKVEKNATLTVMEAQNLMYHYRYFE